jgi:hypothetical protein
MNAPWTEPAINRAMLNQDSTKKRILDLLLKVQRDNLAEIVACRTEDRSLANAAAEFESRVELMRDEDNFLPILNEMKGLFY